MLTKDQAYALADSLVAESRSARRHDRMATFRGIPSYYRSKALLALPLTRQADLLATARRTAGRTKHAVSVMVCWVAFLALLVYPLWTARKSGAIWFPLMFTSVMLARCASSSFGFGYRISCSRKRPPNRDESGKTCAESDIAQRQPHLHAWRG